LPRSGRPHKINHAEFGIPPTIKIERDNNKDCKLGQVDDHELKNWVRRQKARAKKRFD